ncbi:CHASE domain-containing protein [Shewanella sp.]|uniref:CHASE domain-containing protein n=1 Tax=Shewanella sp. TaxID=50422 RepID=UPI003568FEA8
MLNRLTKHAQTKNYKWANFTSIILLLTGLFVAVTLKENIEIQNDALIKSNLTQQSNQFSLEVKDRIQKFEYGLQGLRGAINTTGFEHFNYQQNLAYFQSRDYPREFPGARGFGVISVTPKNQLNIFLQQANQDRQPPFSLKQLNAHQDPLFIVKYIEPEQPNIESLGLDIGSEPNRRRAALSSAVANAAVLTAPITLVQADSKINHGFLLLLPIYDTRNMANVTPAELLGWVYAPLLINDILKTITDQQSNLNLTINDISTTEHVPFFTSDTHNSNNEQRLFEKKHTVEKIIEVYGRQWAVQLTPSKQWFSTLHLPNPQQVFFITLSVTVLLIIVLHMFLRYITRSMDSVRQKISLSSFIENSSECLIGVDSAFTILNWNQSAETIFNLQKTVSEKQPIINYLNDGITTDALIAYFKKVARGERVSKIEFSHQALGDTEARSLVLTITPLLKDNLFLGASFTINDISDFKALQTQLQQHNIELKTKVDENTIEIEQANLFQQNILNSSKVVVIATDPTGVITFFSKGAEQQLRYNTDEILGKNVTKLMTEVVPNNNDLVLNTEKTSLTQPINCKNKDLFNYIEQQLQLQQHPSFTCRLKQKYGDYKQVSLHVSAMKERNLGRTRYVFVVEDLTEKNALQKQLNLTTAAVEYSHNILLWLTSDGVIVRSNPYANNALGYSANDMSNKHINNLLASYTEQSWIDTKLKLLHSQPHGFKCQLVTAQKEILPVNISAGLINSDNTEYIFIEAQQLTSREQINRSLGLLSSPKLSTTPRISATTDTQSNLKIMAASQLRHKKNVVTKKPSASKATLTPQTEGAPKNKTAAQANTLETFCDKHHIDFAKALTRLSDNKIIYIKALELLINDLNEYAAIDTLKTKDVPGLKLMFHTLKSAAATLGFNTLAQFANQQENIIKADTILNKDVMIEQLTQQTNSVLPIAHNLLQLLQNKLPPKEPILQTGYAPKVTDECLATFQILSEEVHTFNMNASNTLAKVSATLSAIAPEQYLALESQMKILNFHQAEIILKALHPLLLEHMNR